MLEINKIQYSPLLIGAPHNHHSRVCIALRPLDRPTPICCPSIVPRWGRVIGSVGTCSPRRCINSPRNTNQLLAKRPTPEAVLSVVSVVAPPKYVGRCGLNWMRGCINGRVGDWVMRAYWGMLECKLGLNQLWELTDTFFSLGSVFRSVRSSAPPPNMFFNQMKQSLPVGSSQKTNKY